MCYAKYLNNSIFLADLKPFVMYVVTDGDEMPDAQNKGFKLMFRQIPCAV